MPVLSRRDLWIFFLLIRDFFFPQRPYGKFDATNSVIVDDTPTKLRAQPDNLIAAPTFDYPEAPSDSTTRRSQLDTFLLAVVSMLDQLAPETNFANLIESRGWNRLRLGTEEEDDDERDDLVNDGVRLVRKAKIAVDAEARGILPGTLPSVNDDAGYRTRKRGTLQGEQGSLALCAISPLSFFSCVFSPFGNRRTGGLGSTAPAVATNSSSSRLLTLDDALATPPNKRVMPRRRRHGPSVDTTRGVAKVCLTLFFFSSFCFNLLPDPLPLLRRLGSFFFSLSLIRDQMEPFLNPFSPLDPWSERAQSDVIETCKIAR